MRVCVRARSVCTCVYECVRPPHNNIRPLHIQTQAQSTVRNEPCQTYLLRIPVHATTCKECHRKSRRTDRAQMRCVERAHWCTVITRSLSSRSELGGHSVTLGPPSFALLSWIVAELPYNMTRHRRKCKQNYWIGALSGLLGCSGPCGIAS